MVNNYKKVLVVSPHTDDGELGAGGTISKLIENGCEVFYLAFSAAEDSVPKEFKKNILHFEAAKATEKLGILKKNLFILNYKVRTMNEFRQSILDDLIVYKKKINPDLVLIPATQDVHQDHSVITDESIRAFKFSTILGYELIWNMFSSESDCFVELEKKHIKKKKSALKQYKSQAKRKYMSDEFIEAQARIAGVQSGLEYAEKFQIIRLYF